MKTYRAVAAAAGLAVSLLVGGAAFGSTISKNLPHTANQAFQGAGHVINEAGRPVHNNVRDLGQNMEGGKGARRRTTYHHKVYHRKVYHRTRRVYHHH